MAGQQAQGGSIILLSFVFLMVLMLLPLSDSLRFARPEFVLLGLIYWSMALPQRVGITYAWLVGLMMDVLMGGMMGIMAFSYAFIIYMVLKFHLQLRQYPLWQQASFIFTLVLLLQLLLVALSSHTAGSHVFLPAVTSTILWPVIYAILRKLRRSFNVS